MDAQFWEWSVISAWIIRILWHAFLLFVFVVQGEPETVRHHHHRHESSSLAWAPVLVWVWGYDWDLKKGNQMNYYYCTFFSSIITITFVSSTTDQSRFWKLHPWDLVWKQKTLISKSGISFARFFISSSILVCVRVLGITVAVSLNS